MVPLCNKILQEEKKVGMSQLGHKVRSTLIVLYVYDVNGWMFLFAGIWYITAHRGGSWIFRGGWPDPKNGGNLAPAVPI